MSRYSLSAVGQDQTGIVAAVTGALADRGCNLQDSTMARLQGQFAILLIVDAPDHVDADSLDAALRPVAEHFALVVTVRPLRETAPVGTASGRPNLPGGDSATESSNAGRSSLSGAGGGEREDDRASVSWTIAVHGADRAGIVHGITAALAAGGGSIVDLATHLVGTATAPVYTLVIRAVVPAESADSTADAMVAEADRLGVRCTIHPDDPDVL